MSSEQGREALSSGPDSPVDPVTTRISRFPIPDAATSVLLLIGLALLLFVSWSLLVPDPYAVVRNSPFAWLEGVSDLLTHTATFTVLSAVWLGIVHRLFRELPPTVVFGMLIYCLVIEGMQAFVPGRHCGPRDALANVAGFVFGLAFVRMLSYLRRTHSMPIA